MLTMTSLTIQLTLLVKPSTENDLDNPSLVIPLFKQDSPLIYPTVQHSQCSECLSQGEYGVCLEANLFLLSHEN